MKVVDKIALVGISGLWGIKLLFDELVSRSFGK